MNRPPDTLRLELGPLPCRIGVLEGEDQHPQRVAASLTLEIELDAVLASGALTDAVDYAPVHASLVQAICGRRWGLIEELAAELMRIGLAPQRVRAATVQVTKLEPPLGVAAGPVTVAFRRERAQ